jgi:hypothetical protein
MASPGANQLGSSTQLSFLPRCDAMMNRIHHSDLPQPSFGPQSAAMLACHESGRAGAQCAKMHSMMSKYRQTAST